MKRVLIGEVISGKHLASSTDFALFQELAYRCYLNCFRDEGWRGYRDFRTGEEFSFDSPRDFFESKDGLEGGDFDLFLKAVGAMASQSKNLPLQAKARELLKELDPKFRAVRECLAQGKTQQQAADEHGIKQPRVSQIISAGANTRVGTHAARLQLSAGTDPATAAERIRERLGDAFADALADALSP